MTLEEAIKHCKEVAEEAKRTPCIKGGLVEKCGKEHEQLARWLTELKERREKEQAIIDAFDDTEQFKKDAHSLE